MLAVHVTLVGYTYIVLHTLHIHIRWLVSMSLLSSISDVRIAFVSDERHEDKDHDHQHTHNGEGDGHCSV